MPGFDGTGPQGCPMSLNNRFMATPDCRERRCRWNPMLLGLRSGASFSMSG